MRSVLRAKSVALMELFEANTARGVLTLVDDHRRHMGHSVVQSLDSVGAVRAVGAFRDSTQTVQLVHGERKRGASLEVVVG